MCKHSHFSVYRNQSTFALLGISAALFYNGPCSEFLNVFRKKVYFLKVLPFSMEKYLPFLVI